MLICSVLVVPRAGISGIAITDPDNEELELGKAILVLDALDMI